MSTGRSGLRPAAWILGSWLVSLIGLLLIPLQALPWWMITAAVLLRTVLQTGLFITAHDAMHGVLLPGHPVWNHRLGRLALLLYAALPYRRCLHQHQQHHRHTATRRDPDFHADPGSSVLGWYRRFMAGYLSPAQMLGLIGLWTGWMLLGRLHHPGCWLNLLMFGCLPLLLSSMQLFLFGTYLPHRDQRHPERQAGPTSLNHPAWLSLLTCFHFGYHREHHDHPGLAWFELPAQRRRGLSLAAFGHPD